MMFTTPFTTFILSMLMALSTMVSAVPIKSRDVYVPPVTYPVVGTVWEVGHQYNVTWDTSNPPQHITNYLGMIVLAKNGSEDYQHPLASNFSILDGTHSITVPTNVTPGDDYSIVLFGDSGNFSPTFTITA